MFAHITVILPVKTNIQIYRFYQRKTPIGLSSNFTTLLLCLWSLLRFTSLCIKQSDSNQTKKKNLNSNKKIGDNICNERHLMHSSFKHKSPQNLNEKSVWTTKNETIKQLASTHKYVALTEPHTPKYRNLHLK